MKINTLDEAIDVIICVGPMAEVRERAFSVLTGFIFQKFNSELLKQQNPDAEKALWDFYERLVQHSKDLQPVPVDTNGKPD